MQEISIIDRRYPTFSWNVDSDRRGARQTAYRIVVSDNEDMTNIIWDSGKVFSDKTLDILYGGSVLEPETRYYWTSTIWDEQGRDYTRGVQWFETGLKSNDKAAWRGAEWIGAPRTVRNTDGVLEYSIDFKLNTDGKSAAALAARNKDNCVIVEMDVNAQRVTVYEYDGGRCSVIGRKKGYDASITNGENHVRVSVRRTYLTVQINGGYVINDADILPDDIVNKPRKTGMMLIGFRQSWGTGEYRDIIITDDKTGDVLMRKPERLVLNGEFYLINPCGSVNLRRFFDTDKEVKKARLYASAKGFYETYINGAKVGQSYYTPGFTDYRKRIYYQTYDVTEMIHKGENVIGTTVTKGYYTGFVGYNAMPMVYGEKNAYIAQLVLTYDDGSQDIIVTDGSWQFTDRGAVLSADYQQGEIYDARMKLEWNNHSDRRWERCGVLAWDGAVQPTNGTLENEKFELAAQIGPSAQKERVLKPIWGAVEKPQGCFIYDFGQNMVGTIRITMRAEKGMSVKIRYGEMLFEGELYTENLRSASNTDVYTFCGDEHEVFEPSFTSHGFRYIEISGNGCILTHEKLRKMIISVEGIVITNTTEITGEFECSNDWINRLQKNIVWGQRGNSLLVYTDCPQRNERMGWTGDVQVFIPTAAYEMYIKDFMTKWLVDLEDAQLLYNLDGAVPDTAPLGGDNRPNGGCGGWGDAAVIAPWELYCAYGDERILERFYPMMKKWVDYQSMPSRQFCGERRVDGALVPEYSDLSSQPYIQIQQSRGDHLAYDETTPFILSATAYAAYAAKLLSKAAFVLGKEDDAKKYEARFENIKKAFCEAWVKDDGSIAYWGEMSKSCEDDGGNIINKTYYSNDSDNLNHPSQTAYALAIYFDLIPKKKIKRAAECLRQSIAERGGRLSVGFLGISHLAPALVKAGLVKEAFAVLEQEECPGWLYSVKNGATTIWERWNSYNALTGEFGDANMNSFNHYAYGAIGAWLFGTVLGINSSDKKDETGYKKIILSPTVGGSLTYAKGSFISRYGVIRSNWRIDGDKLYYSCTVPANTNAVLYLPAISPESVTESGKSAASAEGVTYIGTSGCKAVYTLQSGSYCFCAER
jgi:alpha-L-rhamnosidase